MPAHTSSLSQAGCPEPRDELTFSCVTAVKFGKPPGETLLLAPLGGNLAKVHKKRGCFVVGGCIAQEHQIFDLAPSRFAALGERRQTPHSSLRLVVLEAAAFSTRPFLGSASAPLFDAAGQRPVIPQPCDAGQRCRDADHGILGIAAAVPR